MSGWEMPERSSVWARLDTCRQRDFHMVLELPRASRTLCSLCLGNSGKLTTHLQRQRKMITAVVTDWQLSPVLTALRAAPCSCRHWQERMGKALKKGGIICFFLLLHHLRQLRSLCIPNSTSVHKLVWCLASLFQRGNYFCLINWTRRKFKVNKNVQKLFMPLLQGTITTKSHISWQRTDDFSCASISVFVSLFSICEVKLWKSFIHKNKVLFISRGSRRGWKIAIMCSLIKLIITDECSYDSDYLYSTSHTRCTT